jgi:uncharacterized protein
MPKPANLLHLLEVRHSAVHGQGVYATGDIAEGQRIALYTGRRIASDDQLPAIDADAPTYLFGLSDGSTIDGAEGGNATRFINHSCEPNCVAAEVRTRGVLGIEIAAAGDIRPGQELFLDYALTVDEDADLYACRCGSAACRGTMAGESAA